MRQNLIGIDIGGTKCAITYGVSEGAKLTVKDKLRFDTTTVQDTIENILQGVSKIMEANKLSKDNVAAVGVSCGGPLSSVEGVVMSPPNLPGWDNIPIVKILEERFGIRAALQNDANACALAEWKFGAGAGTRNMAFLTFGTGLGAGLVIDGRLFAGTNDNAGEVGHLRLADYGPVGYGKAGSFEGFCSGSGIAQLAQTAVREKMQMGERPALLPVSGLVEEITAKDVSEAAAGGDALALDVMRTSGEQLGRGLSILIDILNPEVIVIGSIYARAEKLLAPHCQRIIEREALPLSRRVCRVVPAALGEEIGDMAALSVAANAI